MNSFEKVNSENYDSLSNTDEDTGKEYCPTPLIIIQLIPTWGLRKVNHTMVNGQRIIPRGQKYIRLQEF